MEDKSYQAAMITSESQGGKCPWCGGFLKFWGELDDLNLDLYHHPVAYGRCEFCGSLSQNPPLDSQQLELAYPDSYWVEGEDDPLLRRLALWYQRKILSLDQGLFMRRILGSLEGKKMLELGPGRGDFLVWARSQGAKVMGWERSPRAVSFLKSKGIRAEAVILEDLSHWPGSGETWDIIAGFHVLEHLVEPVRIVAGLLSHLAPNGLLVFQLPRIDSWQANIFGRQWFALEVPRHVSIPSIKGLKQWASLLNLELVDLKHFSLRDNAFCIVASLFPNLIPHRPGFGGLEMMLLLVGTWCFQPLAFIEALTGRGGTVMMAFQKKPAT